MTSQTFNDNELLEHILSRKPAEKLVDIPEWEVEILCRALNARNRLEVEAKAYDTTEKTSDLKRSFYLVVMYGCYNPSTGNLFFKQQHEKALMEQQDGGPVEQLALAILRLSRMLPGDAENAKKN
jgi:hypothetical protein